MMWRSLEQWLDLRRGDWALLLFFFGFNVLLWASLAMGEALAESLFLTRFGVAFLPHMFLVAALIAIPATMLYTCLIPRLRPISLDGLVAVGSVLALATATGLVGSGWRVGELDLSCPFLYLVNTGLGIIWPAHFWVLTSSTLATLDAKRLLPLVMTGAVVGSFSGGIVVSALAPHLSMAGMIEVWLLINALAGVWILVGRLRGVSAATARVVEAEGDVHYVDERWFQRLRHELAALFSHRLITLVVVAGLLLTMIRYVIEFRYSAIFAAAITDENQLATFYGGFAAVSSVLALALQTLVTPRLIRILGVAGANLVYPAITIGVMSMLCGSSRLLAGVVARFHQDSLRRAICQPVANLMYNAIPPKRRSRTVAINEGLIVGLGTVLAALFLIQFGRDARMVSAAGLILAVAFGIVSWRMRTEYTNSLVGMLRSSRIEALVEHQQEIGCLDSATEKLVIEALADENEEVVALAGELLSRWGRAEGKHAIVRQMRLGSLASRRILTRFLDRIPGDEARQCLADQLESDYLENQLMALRVLGGVPLDPGLRRRIAPFLAHPDDRLRAMAVVPMLRDGDLDQMLGALQVLKDFLGPGASERRVLAVRAIAALGDRRFWLSVSGLLHDPEPMVREAVLDVALALGEREATLPLADVLPLLNDPNRAVRAGAIQVVGRIGGNEARAALIDALDDPSPRNRRLVQDVLAGFGESVYPALFMMLGDDAADVRKHHAAVGLLARSPDPEVRTKLLRYGESRIERLYRLTIDRHVVAAQADPEAGRFLRMVLEEKSQALLRLLLALVAPRERIDALRSVYRKIRSTDRELSGSAIEVLQTMGERRLIYHLLPVLEDLDLEEVARYGATMFQLAADELRGVVGRHLLSPDPELRVAAAYTVGAAGIGELVPALERLTATRCDGDFADVARWSLDRLRPGELSKGQAAGRTVESRSGSAD